MSESGQSKLWGWFGLGRASFLVVPRVLLHEMPDEWQGKLADLMQEYDEAFPNWPELYSYVTVKGADNKFTEMPEWLKNYRHPNKSEIDSLRPKSSEQAGSEAAERNMARLQWPGFT